MLWFKKWERLFLFLFSKFTLSPRESHNVELMFFTWSNEPLFLFFAQPIFDLFSRYFNIAFRRVLVSLNWIFLHNLKIKFSVDLKYWARSNMASIAIVDPLSSIVLALGWVSREIWDFVCFVFLLLWIGLEDWQYPLGQSTASSKQKWFAFSRASTQISYWLTVVLTFHLIGHYDHERFGFITLNRNALYFMRIN